MTLYVQHVHITKIISLCNQIMVISIRYLPPSCHVNSINGTYNYFYLPKNRNFLDFYGQFDGKNHGRIRPKSRPRSGRFETTAVEVGAVDFWRPTANTITNTLSHRLQDFSHSSQQNILSNHFTSHDHSVEKREIVSH